MIVGLLLTLLNVGLVAIPIGGTVGALAGVDQYRISHGQEPLFPHASSGGDVGSSGGGSSGGGSDGGDDGGDGGSSGNSTWTGNKPNATTVIGGITVKEYCQQYAEVDVNTTAGQNYTLSPNQWGWTKSEGGGLCLNVTTNNNNTYATNVTAPHWSAIWQYPKGSDTQPVHAFPNIKIAGDIFPAKLGSLSEMVIDLEWSYTSGNTVIGGSTTTAAAATAATAAAAATASTATAGDVLSSLESSAAAAETASAAAASADTSTASTAAAAAATDAVADTSTAVAAVAASSTPSAAAAAATTAVTTSAAAATTAASIARRAVNTTALDFNANVAIDMFFDSKKAVSGETGNATYEVMVWFARFGAYTDPIGYTDGIVSSQILEGVNFTLYNGTNSYKQHVYTWVAEEPATTFTGDILPLITVLSTLNLDDVPGTSDYIGYFSLGTEAYYSTDEVTFDVQSLSMDIW